DSLAPERTPRAVRRVMFRSRLCTGSLRTTNVLAIAHLFELKVYQARSCKSEYASVTLQQPPLHVIVRFQASDTTFQRSWAHNPCKNQQSANRRNRFVGLTSISPLPRLRILL